MHSRTKPARVRSIGALIGIGTLVAATQVGGLASPPVQAQVPPNILFDSGQQPFELGEILGGTDGESFATLPEILGTDTRISQNGTLLYPIDSDFTTDELDFFGATPRSRDGVHEEGYAGEVTKMVDHDGDINTPMVEVTGLELSDVATDEFKAGAPLGTWAAGLGGESVKASTEHFTIMESILTCYQTHPYDFWSSREDYELGLPSVPQATQEALEALGRSCERLTSPNELVDLDGNPILIDELNPNEDSVVIDMAVDPELGYSVTKKDDGKPLFRWGTSVKRPTDIRFQKTIELPDDWTDPALAGQRGYPVIRAELVVRHNITNNPNDQIRPEDWENEAATGLLPDYEQDGDNWVSTRDCYEGDGDFIPAGTTYKYPSGAIAGVAADDLANGFTPAWYTTIDRDPFQWSFRNIDTGELVGAKSPGEIDAAQANPDLVLVSGPRWRMTSNKFGQDLPGLEIPVEECTLPPYQKDDIRYEVGEFETTTINLLDWDAAEPRWDDAVSPFAYSGGWISTWSGLDTIPGQLVDPVEDAIRCESGDLTTGCVTDLGTSLTDGFDVTMYVKGDQKPLQVFDVQLIIEYGPEPILETNLDFGDAPDTYGTTLVSVGARHTVSDDLRLGALVDIEDDGLSTALADGDDTTGDDDEDGVTFSALRAGATGTATVALTGSGNVSGWIDFNGDGDFTDAGEQVVADATAGGALNFTIPATAKVGPTFARFRASDQIGVGATGYGGNGEVEDHPVTILTPDVVPPVEPPVQPPTEGANAFLPLTPTRVLDTRNSSLLQLGDWDGSGPLQAGSTVAIPVRSAIPAGSPVAVVNVTATRAAAAGFLTVYECDQPLPNASNLNYLPGQDVARAALAFAPVSAAGQVCVYSSATTDLIVDVSGYTPSGGSYVARNPVRLADTRGASPLAADATLRVAPPATGGDALAISVTAVNPSAPGFLTAYSCDDGLPTISTLNYTTGASMAIANMTIVGTGDICVTASAPTDVLVDLQGHFTEPVALGKARLLDTRSGARPAAGSTTRFDPTTIPAFANSPMAAVNVTATRATEKGFLTVWNCADPLPNASVLNYEPGDTFAIANLAMLKTTSPICVYTSAPTDIILDLVAVTP
jgi:hypothetical protein